MKSILNTCPLFAINFFVGQRCYYYHRLLCHSLVRSVILLGIVHRHYKELRVSKQSNLLAKENATHCRRLLRGPRNDGTVQECDPMRHTGLKTQGTVIKVTTTWPKITFLYSYIKLAQRTDYK